MPSQEKITEIKNWLQTGSLDIFGLPFAGKDFQCRRLADIFDGNVLGSGDIFRNSEMPDNIKECMRTGRIVPSEDFVKIVLPFLSQTSLSNKPLILSSVGRCHGEEAGVIESLRASNHPLKTAIYLDISTEDSFTRWTDLITNADRPGRIDDSKEILETRFIEFEEKTKPVIDYYRNINMLIEIDGRKSRDEVTNDILNYLYELITL